MKYEEAFYNWPRYKKPCEKKVDAAEDVINLINSLYASTQMRSWVVSWVVKKEKLIELKYLSNI